MTTNLVDFSGKQVLVTGASSGIGRETAILLSRLGASIVATGRDPAALQQTLEFLQGDRHAAEAFDLSKVNEIPDWLLTLAQKHGRFDGVAHLAGRHEACALKMAEPEFVANLFQINVAATIALVRGFRHRKVRHETSSVVLVSSVAALIGEAGISTYAATKGAIVSLTKSLAAELAREKIRVNCVSPSLVKSELLDRLQQNVAPEQFKKLEAAHLLGLGQPIDVANAIAFLLSDACQWMTGTNLVLDGGYSLR